MYIGTAFRYARDNRLSIQNLPLFSARKPDTVPLILVDKVTGPGTIYIYTISSVNSTKSGRITEYPASHSPSAGTGRV